MRRSVCRYRPTPFHAQVTRRTFAGAGDDIRESSTACRSSSATKATSSAARNGPSCSWCPRSRCASRRTSPSSRWRRCRRCPTVARTAADASGRAASERRTQHPACDGRDATHRSQGRRRRSRTNAPARLDQPRDARSAAGLAATPAQQTIKFARQDESLTVRFAIKPASDTRAGRVSTRARSSPRRTRRRSTAGYQMIEYPHIRRQHIYDDADASVKVINVKTRAEPDDRLHRWASATRCRRRSSSSASRSSSSDAGGSGVGRPVAVHDDRHRRPRLRTARRSAREQQPAARLRVQTAAR